MGKTVISAPKVEHYTNVSDFLESNPYSAAGWLYKIGPLCFVFLSARWDGYSGNTNYTMGKLKSAYRPVDTIYLPAFISRSGGVGINAPTYAGVNPNGDIIMTTGAWNQEGAGFADVWACYFCEK